MRIFKNKKNLFLFILVLLSILLPRLASAVSYEADEKPWSGWWWPFTSGGIVTGKGYNGHPAPLEKYDLVTHGSMTGPATQYGLANYYDPSAKGWEGLCFLWAVAAMMEREPSHRGIYGGTLFNVGDKKGILTAAYDGVNFRRHAIRNPMDFQEILGRFIRNQRSVIVMDLGTDGEVWNYPVFKYDINSTKLGNTNHYTVKVYYATDSVSPDYVGTRVSSKTYYYFYETEGSVITRSGWERGSENGPPVNASEPYGLNSVNPGLDYNTVLDIVYTDDDPYEPNDDFESAATLTSGRHLLIAADRDYFRVALRAGDRLKIRVEAEVPDSLEVRLYDPAKSSIGQICDRCAVTTQAMMTGDYVIEVFSADSGMERVYELYLEQGLPFRGLFPHDPKGAWEGGLTLLSGGGDIGRLILCQTDEAGAPEKSYNAVVEKGYLEGFLETFGLTGSSGGYVRVDSDRPLTGLYTAMDGSNLMVGGNYVPVSRSSQKLVFPHIATVAGWNTWFGFLNVGDSEEELDLAVYDVCGNLLTTERWILEPGEKFEDDRFTGMFPARGDSATIVTRSGRKALIGYLRYQSSMGQSMTLGVLDGPCEEMYLPHVASVGDWWTGVVVMNGGRSTAEVVLTAYDAGGKVLDSMTRFLEPNENMVSMATALFPSVPAPQVASLGIDGGLGSELHGLVIYGSADEAVLSGAHLGPPRAGARYIPQVLFSSSWWEGLATVHRGATRRSVCFDLMDDEGTVVRRVFRNLNPGERFVVMLESLFGQTLPDGAKYLRVDAGDARLSGVYLQGSWDGRFLSGDTLAGVGE